MREIFSFTKWIKAFALLMVLLCATTSWAQTNVSTDQALRDAIADNANIMLTADIDLSNSTLAIPANSTVTIDLNSHKLDRKLTKRGESGGTVITVRSGATLNLMGGTLKGGWGGNGGGLVNEGGTANLTNVTITGNVAVDRGGGISNQGTLNMTGGAITDNTCQDNTAPRGGGGLFNYSGATATLTNVTITGNKTTAGFGGGGICNHGTLTIDGSSITGNTAGTHGGGIWTDGTLNVQGALVVKDNLRADGVKDNLHLTSGKLLTLTGTITDSDIRVNMEKPGVFTSGYNTYHSGTHPSQILIPDFLPYWGVSQNDNGEACLTPQKEGSVSFIERSWDDVNKKVVCTRRVWEAGEYVVLTPTDDFYICSHTKILVRGDVTFEYNLLINTTEPVAIVLADNSHLQVPAIVGRKGHYDMSLSIYAEEGGGTLGRITSCVPHNSDNSETAAIGARKNNTTAVTIHGGNIYADGGNFAPGIGSVNGSQDRAGADITIYGGNITAIGGSGSAGIGGGYDVPNYGNIRIYGGTISAQGGRALGYAAASSGPGIGGGHNCTGGTTHIYGGDITAVGTYEGAGIGSSQTADSETGAGHIIIDGGHIVARGHDYAAGIGGGDGVNGNRIEINGGEVYAYGGKDAAGIGGGEGGDAGTITITDGYVYAQGGTDYGAGIGGGEDGDGGNITITGGTVIAKAGKNETGLRAIGPGAGSDNYGTLTIGDLLMVSSERKATAAERKAMCWYRTQARLEPCTHSSLTYTITDEATHTAHCAYCTTAFAAVEHTFVNNVCTVCGAGQTTFTVSVYLPNGSSYGSATTYTMASGETFNLPAAPDNNIPSNVEFAGWLVGNPPSMDNIVTDDTETLQPVGTEYTIRSDVSFTARYQYINISLIDNVHNGEVLSTYNGKEAQTVTLSGRTLYRDGKWNTLCLPFDASLTGDLADATVKELDVEGWYDGSTRYTEEAEGRRQTGFDPNTGTLYLYFKSASSIVAGTPYIIKWGTPESHPSSNLTNPTFSNVTINNTRTEVESADHTLVFAGAYSPLFISQENKNLLYLGGNNTLYYPSPAPESTITIGSCRAHFRLKGIEAGDPSDPSSPVKAFVLNFGEDDATSIHNSQFIIHNEAGAWYTLDGRKLSGKPIQKGIYIVNGKKILTGTRSGRTD